MVEYEATPPPLIPACVGEGHVIAANNRLARYKGMKSLITW